MEREGTAARLELLRPMERLWRRDRELIAFHHRVNALSEEICWNRCKTSNISCASRAFRVLAFVVTGLCMFGDAVSAKDMTTGQSKREY